MKTSTPKKVSKRTKVVDSMAKKFADSGSVTTIITAHRKRQMKPAVYIYILIGLSVVSTGVTTLIMTGKISVPGSSRRTAAAITESEPVASTITLLQNDLAEKEINADEYVLYLKDYLIRYDSLPGIYKSPRSSTTSTEIYRALFDIWPQVSLRTRATLLKVLPFLEDKWRSMQLERKE